MVPIELPWLPTCRRRAAAGRSGVLLGAVDDGGGDGQLVEVPGGEDLAVVAALDELVERLLHRVDQRLVGWVHRDAPWALGTGDGHGVEVQLRVGGLVG